MAADRIAIAVEGAKEIEAALKEARRLPLGRPQPAHESLSTVVSTPPPALGTNDCYRDPANGTIPLALELDCGHGRLATGLRDARRKQSLWQGPPAPPC